MEDDDALLTNDPLAIYLLNEEMKDFEMVEQLAEQKSDLLTEKSRTNFNKEYQSWVDIILKSQLLLEEDFNVLQSYCIINNSSYTNGLLIKLPIIASVLCTGFLMFKYQRFKIFSLSFLPVTYPIYSFIKQKLKKRKFVLLLNELSKLNNLMKKSLKLISELATTVPYYSPNTLQYSSINIENVRFAKKFYSVLLTIIKLLVCNASEIVKVTSFENEQCSSFKLPQELTTTTDVTVRDLKVLYDIYLLVQSDFVKILGLSLCNSIRKPNPCDVDVIITQSVPTVLNSIRHNINLLNEYYNFLFKFGTYYGNRKTTLNRKRNTSSPLNFMNSCLHNTELHFQQLLCKSRDLQNIICEVNSTDDLDNITLITTMLNEMDKQLISSKNMVEVVSKYFTQIYKKDTELKLEATMPQNLSAVQDSYNKMTEKDTISDKLVYELYIPKEGLELSELEVNTELPVFSMKDLDYSRVLLDELRTILRARNPETFQEKTESHDSESESEEEISIRRRKKCDVFRPVQPVGLAENLQTLSEVFAARKNMLQCEEIIDDTFTNSD